MNQNSVYAIPKDQLIIIEVLVATLWLGLLTHIFELPFIQSDAIRIIVLVLMPLLSLLYVRGWMSYARRQGINYKPQTNTLVYGFVIIIMIVFFGLVALDALNQVQVR